MTLPSRGFLHFSQTLLSVTRIVLPAALFPGALRALFVAAAAADDDDVGCGGGGGGAARSWGCALGAGAFDSMCLGGGVVFPHTW